jgi:hypothetical protein
MNGASFSTAAGFSVALVALGCLPIGCRSVEPPPPVSCTYAGTPHAIGTSFPAGDGCNTCACVDDGIPLCTQRACPEGNRDGGQPARTDAASTIKVDSAPAPDVAMTSGPDAPRGPDAPHACDFSTSYEYGDIGGLRAFVERTILEPGNKYTHLRRGTVLGPPLISCSPPLPSCGALDIITAYDIEVHDLGDPDVLAALAQPTPPLFGRDTRPVDGVVFEFVRKDGRGFLVGSACPGNSGQGNCRDIPRGIAQITARLRELDRQQLRANECRGFRMP